MKKYTALMLSLIVITSCYTEEEEEQQYVATDSLDSIITLEQEVSYGFLKKISLHQANGMSSDLHHKINVIPPPIVPLLQPIDWKIYMTSYANHIYRKYDVFFSSHVSWVTFLLNIDVGQYDAITTSRFSSAGDMIGGYPVGDNIESTNKFTFSFNGSSKSNLTLTHDWRIGYIRTINRSELVGIKRSHAIELNKPVDGIMTGAFPIDEKTGVLLDPTNGYNGHDETIYFNVQYDPNYMYHVFLEHIPSEGDLASLIVPDRQTPDFDIFVTLGQSTPIYPSRNSYHFKSDEGRGFGDVPATTNTNKVTRRMSINEAIQLYSYSYSSEYSRMWIAVKKKGLNGGHFRLRVNKVDDNVVLNVHIKHYTNLNSLIEKISYHALVKLSARLYAATEGKLFVSHFTIDGDGCFGWCDVYFENMSKHNGLYYSITDTIYINTTGRSIVGTRNTFAHEFGHKLGLPDEYHVGAASPNKRTGHSIMSNSVDFPDFSVSRNHGKDKEFNIPKRIWALGWPSDTESNWSYISRENRFDRPKHIVQGETPDPYLYQQDLLCNWSSGDPFFPGRSILTEPYDTMISKFITVNFEDVSGRNKGDRYRYPSNCAEMKKTTKSHASGNYTDWLIKVP